MRVAEIGGAFPLVLICGSLPISKLTTFVLIDRDQRVPLQLRAGEARACESAPQLTTRHHESCDCKAVNGDCYCGLSALCTYSNTNGDCYCQVSDASHIRIP